MKIHCAQLVEDALRSALDPASSLAEAPIPASGQTSQTGPSLADQITPTSGKVKITLLPKAPTA
jgi:hypothetical protein